MMGILQYSTGEGVLQYSTVQYRWGYSTVVEMWGGLGVPCPVDTIRGPRMTHPLTQKDPGGL